MATMKNKAVSFNIENEQDRTMLEYVNKMGNFSQYIKNLIGKDMHREASIKKPDIQRMPGGGINIRLD